MALADSVPGVSGGTVAFILGFYERFLNALHILFGRKTGEKKKAFIYLCRLGAGWCAGMVLSVVILAKLFAAQIYFLSSLFLGLTVASLPFIIIEEKKAMKAKWWNLLYAVIGIALVCGLTAFRTSSVGADIDYMALQPVHYLYLFVAGMLAIAAMVLPGISGSTLLLIFGVYLPTISAIRAFLSLNFAVVPGLAALGLGIICGIAVSIHFIRAALRKHRTQMMYLIIGLMVGSLYAVAMGPTTLDVPAPPLSWDSFSAAGFLLGIAILFGLEKLRKTIEKKEIGPLGSVVPEERLPEERI